MRAFYNGIKTMKVRDLPAYVKPMLTLNKAKQTIGKGLDMYHDKYIETNSADPIFHICIGGMIFFYLVNLPEERRHLAHQEKLAAGHH
ncbi:Fiber protein Fb15 [Zostera marina]|uniref:Fiber protein Fb15 n=1 Tax=Zostera marina TaxID=29655 RepID=A0A0K9PP04_ZOSMR|nr:Fiber protein Fb15 [Zostera marina]